MNTRCVAALFLGLLPFGLYADDSASSGSVDADSVWVTSIASAGDGFVAGTATGLLLRPGSVSSFSPSSPQELTELYQHPAAVWTVDATSDGKTIVSADYKGNLVVYDVANKTPTTHENVFERWCQQIVISPDSQSVVAGNESGKLFVWNLQDAKVSKSAELGKASVTSIAFAPNHKQIAATDGSGKVHLLKWPTLESDGVVSISDETAWCVAYENNETLIVGSADRNLYRVAAKTDPKPSSIAKGSDWITRIAVSPSGQIAASEVSGKIHFASGGGITTIGAESGVWSLAFHSDGQLLVGTRKNGIVTAGQSWTWKPIESQQESETDSQEKEESDSEPAASAESDDDSEKDSGEEKAGEDKE